MKKYGFTLAEVLITLAIIGVVATLTLPALMTNTQEQQAKTALKKGINTLTEAAQMNAAIAGFDYSSVTETSAEDGAQSLYGLMATRTNMDYNKSSKDKDDAKKVQQGGSNNYVIFFRDGSALVFNQDNSKVGGRTGKENNEHLENDGLPYGISVIYDTNGVKGPNLLSNCQGNASLKINNLATASDADSTNEDYNAACTKSTRVIKDQFGVRLRGGYAFPNGAAARWAFNN